MDEIKKSNRKITALIVVLVLLVVLLSTALGWMIYKDISSTNEAAQRSERTSSDEKKSSQESKDLAVTEKSEDVVSALKFPGWDVEAVLNASDTPYATKATWLGTGIHHDITAPVEGCWSVDTQSENPRAVQANIGSISQYVSSAVITAESGMIDQGAIGKTYGEYYMSTNADNPNHAVQVGDFTYTFRAPHQGCGDPLTPNGQKANSEVERHSREFRENVFIHLRILARD